jgi:cytochrome c-type biogenesis protein CcmH/NrfF
VSARRLLAALLALLACAAAGGLAASPALAQSADPKPKASLADVEDEVMCDTCNVALYVAESPRADQLRREIRVLIAEGRTKAQIKDELEARYGPAILAMPQDRGFSLGAYLVPILVALGLVALALVLLPRWRRRARAAAAAPAASGPALSADDARRLDDELARFET